MIKLTTRLAVAIPVLSALAFAAPLLGLSHGAMAEMGDPIPEMTIKIYNNSPDYNIYPVLSTGTSDHSLWMQSAFKVLKKDLERDRFPKPYQFRFFVNPKGDGIPPNSSVTVTLPLYSLLVPEGQVDPTKPNQVIDWWGGGRIEIFDAPADDHKPPATLTKIYNDRPGQTAVNPVATAEVPTCPECQPLKFFKDLNGLKHNEPSQLTEYTLGAINQNKNPMELNDHNVDFDVSYVDDAYLPVAMEPYGNEQVGYVGMLNSIDDFRKSMKKFLNKNSPYTGWPQFVTDEGETILKVPSTLHIFGGDPDLTDKPWPPINQMNKRWNDCTETTDDKTAYCRRNRKVRALFQKNYDTYKKKYDSLGCDPDRGPIKLTEKVMRQHVQGWTPFGEGCDNPTVNLLEKTPGYRKDNSEKYQKTKEIFDDLQYLPSGEFNPYALMIHSPDYIGAPNVYAYSVDDAVGNMQADGTGFIIAVGGKKGLPNPHPATPPIHVSFGYAPTDAIRFARYGICSDTADRNVDPDFPSFDISITSIDDCKLTFVDTLGRAYVFQVKSQPPYPKVDHLTPKTHKPINCAGNTHDVAKTWCDNIFAYTLVGPRSNDNYVITPALPQVP